MERLTPFLNLFSNLYSVRIRKVGGEGGGDWKERAYGWLDRLNIFSEEKKNKSGGRPKAQRGVRGWGPAVLTGDRGEGGEEGSS